MKCPRCVQSIHRSASNCPHCGFSQADADALFGHDDVRVHALCDDAGVLKADERRRARAIIERFEETFPKNFLAVYFGSFDEVANIRQFAFWLLNRAAFEDIEVTRANENGLLLCVDVSGKAATIAYGYGLQPFFDERMSFAVLSAAHPYFIQGQYFRSFQVVAKRLSSQLKWQAKRARRSPDAFEVRKNDGNSNRLLQKIRARHRLHQTRL